MAARKPRARKARTKTGQAGRPRRNAPSEKKNKCGVCQKNFSAPRNLRVHQERVHEGQRIYCDFPGCSKSFTRPPTYVNIEKPTTFRRQITPVTFQGAQNPTD